jgi:hypothetical protein
MRVTSARCRAFISPAGKCAGTRRQEAALKATTDELRERYSERARHRCSSTTIAWRGGNLPGRSSQAAVRTRRERCQESSGRRAGTKHVGTTRRQRPSRCGKSSTSAAVKRIDFSDLITAGAAPRQIGTYRINVWYHSQARDASREPGPQRRISSLSLRSIRPQ